MWTAGEHTPRLFRNRCIFQECRRSWQSEGKDLSFSDMEKLASACEPLRFRIDPRSEEFLAPGNMPRRIADAAEKNGARPEAPGEIVRCAYDSLALAVRDVLRLLEKLRDRRYEALHIVGGGTQAELLMQLISDACGIPVLAGPVEATAIGNLAAQMIASGDLADLASARQLVAQSFELRKYVPRDDVNKRYERA